MLLTNPLKEALLNKEPQKPPFLKNLLDLEFKSVLSQKDSVEIQKLFPKTQGQPILKLKKGKGSTDKKRVGVVFSGGQAPGGHNVLLGIAEALRSLNPDSTLLGFLNGPSGFLKQKAIELTDEVVRNYQNLGGFDLIGSGRTKIETKEQFEEALKSAQKFCLDGFIIIGGDDSNTNAAHLAEYFKSKEQKTAVIGVPKTMDGDLKNEYVEVSFGFDTASKVYAELIGNILTDAKSSKKYYHFIKLMGRAASHITLECGLKTCPNLLFIGEEVQDKNISLDQIIEMLVDLIQDRADLGKNYGVILIPEGLIDFIPELKILNQEINSQLAQDPSLNPTSILEKLSLEIKELYQSLPKSIQDQLLLERDPHGNIQLAKIDTQTLLMQMTQKRIQETTNLAHCFHPISHYFGYEGRSAHPSPFDANYTYTLGYAAALLVSQGHTGYMACVKNLKQDSSQWELFGKPITNLLHLEKRHGKEKAVIKKALVDLKQKNFQSYLDKRNRWRLEDLYNSPGPIQYFGPKEITDIRNYLLES